MGSVIRGIGKVVGTAAPLAGLITGIGPLAAAGIGAGGKLLSGASGQDIATGAAMGAGGGLAQKLGALNTEGRFDPSKAVGLAGTAMNLIGQGQQRKSAQDYANANIAQRNALMSKILAPQSYNLNQQSSATPGTGAGSPGAY